MAQRKEKFIKGMLVDTIGIISTLVVGVITPPLYFRYITSKEFGFWTMILELITLLSLLNSGMIIYLVQTISSEINNGICYTKKALSAAFTLQLILIFFMLLAGLSAFHILPALREASIELPESSGMYAVMMIYLFINSLFGWFLSIIYGQNKQALHKSLGAFNRVICQSLPILFLAFGFGLISFPFAYLTGNLVILIISVLLTASYLKDRLSPSAFLNKLHLKQASDFSLKSIIGGVGYYVINFTDMLIIANFLSNTYVTIYALTMKLGNFSKFITSRIITTGFPGIVQLITEKEYERVRTITLKFFRLGVRIGCFLGGTIFFLNRVFVFNWVGHDKYGGDILSLLSALICFRESVYPIFHSIIYSTKDIKTINYVYFFEALSNLLLSIFLIKLWGINGVALATVLSSSFISVSYGSVKASKIIKLNISNYVPSFILTIIRSFPSLLVLWLGRYYLSLDFSWVFFILILFLASTVNIFCFEGLPIIRYRKYSIKEIIKKLIDDF